MARSAPASASFAVIPPAPPPSIDPREELLRQIIGNANSKVSTLTQARRRMAIIAELARQALAAG